MEAIVSAKIVFNTKDHSTFMASLDVFLKSDSPMLAVPADVAGELIAHVYWLIDEGIMISPLADEMKKLFDGTSSKRFNVYGEPPKTTLKTIGIKELREDLAPFSNDTTTPFKE